MTAEDSTPPDPFAELRARIRETAEAAQRVQREADEARAADDAGRCPPSGWATPEEQRGRLDDIQGLAALLGSLRELLPAEFQANLNDLIHQMVALARAVLAWCIERVQAATGLSVPAPATSAGPTAPEASPGSPGEAPIG